MLACRATPPVAPLGVAHVEGELGPRRRGVGPLPHGLVVTTGDDAFAAGTETPRRTPGLCRSAAQRSAGRGTITLARRRPGQSVTQNRPRTGASDYHSDNTARPRSTAGVWGVRKFISRKAPYLTGSCFLPPSACRHGAGPVGGLAGQRNSGSYLHEYRRGEPGSSKGHSHVK